MTPSLSENPSFTHDSYLLAIPSLTTTPSLNATPSLIITPNLRHLSRPQFLSLLENSKEDQF